MKTHLSLPRAAACAALLVVSSLTASAQTLYVGTYGSNILALSPTGTLQSTYVADESRGYDFTVDGSTVYFQSSYFPLILSSVSSAGGSSTDFHTSATDDGQIIGNGGIVVDPANHDVYYSIFNDIRRIDGTTHAETTIWSSDSTYLNVRDLSFDAVHQQIYFTGDADGFDYVNRTNLDGSLTTQVLSLRDTHNPIALEVDGLNGHLFLTGGYQDDIALLRADLDGGNVTTLISGSDLYYGVTVAPDLGRLFALNGDGTLYSANFDGTDMTAIYSAYDLGPRLAFSAGAGSPVPEPSTYAACAGLAVLGLAGWRRRRTPHSPKTQPTVG